MANVVNVTMELVGWETRGGRLRTLADYNLPKYVDKGMQSHLKSLQRSAVQSSPVGRSARPDGKRLRDSWEIGANVSGNSATYELRNTAPQAAFVFGGVREHVIEGRDRVLRWVNADGSIGYAWSVNHPGTPPNPLLDHLARESEGGLGRVIADVEKSLIGEIDAIFSG